VTYRSARRIYQIVFFALFAFLLAMTTQGWIGRFPSTLFPDMSLLSGLTTILSQHNLAGGMILGVLIAATTLFIGRFFCGWICPMGAIQNLAFRLFRNRQPKVRYAKNTWSKGQRVKYFVLIGVLVAAAFGVVLAGYFDPIALLTRFSITVVWPVLNLVTHGAVSQTVAFDVTMLTGIIFIGAFLLNIWQPRFWCRTVCPLGGLLGLFSRKPLFRMVRDTEKCIDCGRCREVCQGACDVDKTLRPAECVMCMSCIDVCPTRAIRFASAPCENISEVEPKIGVSRRAFLISGVTAFLTVGVLRNFKNVLMRGFPLRIRPPGALPEQHFLARCLRCGECMKACPTNVIQPAANQTDLEGLWTPVLNMQMGYCDYDCTQCSQVCPTQAIRPITLKKKHEQGYGKIGTAYVDKSRCLPWAYGKTCLVCQEVCPVSPKAIFHQKYSFETREGKLIELLAPAIDSQACIGCGACQYNCPVQDLPAIRVTSIGEFRSPERKLDL
jgi:MauM/NapG family ferredoxin protein